MAKVSSTPPANQGTGNEDPRSDTAGAESEQELIPAKPTSVSASPAAQIPGRGRGRPPKTKSDSNPNDGGSAKPARKPSGRPKRNLAVSTTSVAAAVKSRGPRAKSDPLPATAAPVTVGGSRKRGRPTKAATTTAAPPKKRGRKPKSEVVAAKSVGRPRKDSSVGPVAAATGELKKKAALLQKKVKEATAKLEKAVAAIKEVQVIVDGF